MSNQELTLDQLAQIDGGGKEERRQKRQERKEAKRQAKREKAQKKLHDEKCSVWSNKIYCGEVDHYSEG